MGHDTRPRALLLDLDGVLRIWNPNIIAQAEERSGLPAGAIPRTAFAPELLRLAVTGLVSDDVWRQRIAEQLQDAFPDADVDVAIRLWSEPPGDVDPAVLSLIPSCRERVAIVLVTNATTRLDRDLVRLGLAGEFDRVINSSAVGHAKPSREIFDHALATVGVTESEAFFVDDNAGNVAAATRYGISGHLYQGISHLRMELARRSIIV